MVICCFIALDFYDKIKLVNFIRLEVQSGRPPSTIPTKDAFEQETYLQPVLKDDPLLYEIEDILNVQHEQHDIKQSKPRPEETKALLSRVRALEEEIERVQAHFMSFKLGVKEVMDKRLKVAVEELSSKSSAAEDSNGRNDIDKSYFDSYAYNGMEHANLCPPTIAVAVWL